MGTINVKTKFDIGDSVFGFVDGEIHNLIIDRIEISIERFNAARVGATVENLIKKQMED